MKVRIKKVGRRPWKKPYQPEFDFDDCYISNYSPLELINYEGDRNYEFYKLQNELILDYCNTRKTNKEILWKMYPYIEGVVESIAKKNVCAGCKVPDFEGKSFEATLRVMQLYKKFPYYRAKKLENVVFHKVREVFLDGNLQLNERTRDFDYVLELEREREKIEMGGSIEDVLEDDGTEN